MSKEEQNEKNSILKTMYEIVKDNSYIYKDMSNTFYCKPFENMLMNIDSEEFLTWCLSICRKKGDIFPTKENVKNLRFHLKDSEETVCLDYYISKRCAYHNDTIYIDLANDKNEIVEINKTGANIIFKTPTPYFKRCANMLPIAKPDLNIASSELLRLIDEFFVVSREQKILLAVWLVLTFVPCIQMPILMITGAKGSSKTTMTRFIRKIVDDNVNRTSIMPSNERDLAILMDNYYLLTFDNISDGDIKGRLSDLISTSITQSTSYTTRQLYSDTSLVSMQLNNRLILNGISHTLLKKSDALDRTIVFNLNRIPVDRMVSIQKLDDTLTRSISLFLGTICNAIVDMLKSIDDVEIENISRMSDFARYGYCVAGALGISGEYFLEIYKKNIHAINDLLLHDDVIGDLILNIMEDRKLLQESVSELYNRVIETAKQIGVNPRELPGSPSHFSTKLLELKSNLSEYGLKISKKNKGTHKEITIVKVK